MIISCVIIDDEPNALRLLEGYISKIPDLLLKGSFFDAVEALAFLKKESVDLVITDINMPLLSGLELAEVLDSNQKFIFTTAFAEHALSSFSYYVIDYLLKPISLKRFIQAIKKSETLFSKPSDHDRTEQQENVVFAKSGKQIVKIDFKEVRYVKGEKEYVSFHFEKERLLVYKRMKEIELLLRDYFKRIHASYII